MEGTHPAEEEDSHSREGEGACAVVEEDACAVEVDGVEAVCDGNHGLHHRGTEPDPRQHRSTSCQIPRHHHGRILQYMLVLFDHERSYGEES